MLRTGMQLRQFILKKEIYCSKISQVWEAQHYQTQRKAVVKVALTWDNPKYSDTANNLVRNESKILPHLSHPGIVQIYPLIAENGSRDVEYAMRLDKCSAEVKPWYFAMQIIEGVSLADSIARIKNFPFEWRIELFYQMLITLEYVHLNGFAHMDLKPQNVMICSALNPTVQPKIKLIDLGCASSNPETLTVEPGGTNEYAPLELLLMLHGRDLGMDFLPVIPVKVDIWGLGAIFFELMTGRPLFPGQVNVMHIRDTLLKEEIASIAHHAVNVPNPNQLDRYLALMLKKDAGKRADIGTLIQYLDEQIAPPPRV